MNKKLIGRLLLVFVIIVLIPAAVIYFTFDIRALEYLTMFKPWSIAAAFGILAVGLIFDGLRLMTLARVTDERLSIKEVINVVLSNYFLAAYSRCQRWRNSPDYVYEKSECACCQSNGNCFCAHDYVDNFFNFTGTVCFV